MPKYDHAFIDRDSEIKELCSKIDILIRTNFFQNKDSYRLPSIFTGSGMGKTRFVMEAIPHLKNVWNNYLKGFIIIIIIIVIMIIIIFGLVFF